MVLDQDLCKRFNGVYSQSIIKGNAQSLDATDELTNYLYNLSIDTASETELENIGKIIGFVRPYVPDEVFDANTFIFYSTSDGYIISSAHGFSSLDDPLYGGRFSSLNTTLNKLPLDVYRVVLKQIAMIKWNGFNFISMDNLLQIAGVSYTILYNSDHDVLVQISSTISALYIYLFRIIFSMFAYNPQVILQEV